MGMDLAQHGKQNFGFKKGFLMVRKDMPPIRIPSAKNDDQPATRKMLYVVRDELKSDIQSLSLKMDSLFHKQDARFDSIDSRFASVESRLESIDSKFESIDSKFESRFRTIDARFNSVDARFDELKAMIADLGAKINYTNIMLEEERSNRQSVLEGHQLLWQRQDRIEQGKG